MNSAPRGRGGNIYKTQLSNMQAAVPGPCGKCWPFLPAGPGSLYLGRFPPPCSPIHSQACLPALLPRPLLLWTWKPIQVSFMLSGRVLRLTSLWYPTGAPFPPATHAFLRLLTCHQHSSCVRPQSRSHDLCTLATLSTAHCPFVNVRVRF